MKITCLAQENKMGLIIHGVYLTGTLIITSGLLLYVNLTSSNQNLTSIVSNISVRYSEMIF